VGERELEREREREREREGERLTAVRGQSSSPFTDAGRRRLLYCLLSYCSRRKKEKESEKEEEERERLQQA
jgi:hypothetical protein